MVLHKIQFLFVSGILQNKLNCCKMFIFFIFLLTDCSDPLIHCWDFIPIQTKPNHTKLMGVDQISQFLPNFAISTKFHNFGQISQLRHSFIISAQIHTFFFYKTSTKVHNWYQISQYWPNYTIFTISFLIESVPLIN